MIGIAEPAVRAMEPVIPSVEILGLPVHNVDMASALEAIDGFVRSGLPHHVVTADASMLVMAQEDEELRGIIAGAALVTPDSTGVLWAAGKRRTPLRERVSGVEIAERLCALSAEQGYRIYFLGAGPGVADAAASKMRDAYPGACIVGTRDGFFSETESASVVHAVREARANVLLVA
ncbi:MAG TPA: WecB/TagA/CpsF family glycosyltransferase, partial [Chthonomonadaceae bacterium]|nr:WecB/TagA/CpsF family glycosyltransferase [Chthonomonadaceae bacterium]